MKQIRLLNGTLFLIALSVIIQSAWLCDDIFITFRTVDNFINGYGLRWNIAERVQTFTHPLWMLLLSALYTVTHNLYYTSIFTTILLSSMTIWLIAFRNPCFFETSVVILVFCTTSKAFIDFSTSGLENPLSHILLVLFLQQYLQLYKKNYETSYKSSLLFYATASCILLNRLDHVLLIFPALCTTLFISRPVSISIKAFLIGFLPIVAWELFSLFYYGFPFPNTAYAKLYTGIPPLVLLWNGIGYFYNSIRWDPVTLIVILGTSIYFLSKRPVVKPFIPIGIGIFLYFMYILKIGGDFMSGRFFTTPFVCCLFFYQPSKYQEP
jgi:arabinofuranosyltransferase